MAFASEPDWRTVVARFPDAVLVLDANMIITSSNAAITEVLGWDAEIMVGGNALEFIHPDDLDTIALRVLDLENPDLISEPSLALRLLRNDGEYQQVEVSARTLEPYSLASGMVINIRDTAAEIARESELQASQTLNDTMLEYLSEGILACDADGIITTYNRAFREMYGLPLDFDLPHDQWHTCHTIFDSQGNALLDHNHKPLQRLLAGESIVRVHLTVERADGSIRHVEDSGKLMVDEHGKVFGAVLAIRDVTTERAAQETLTRRALYDPLTGLANRVLLEERLQLALDRASRAGKSVLTMFIDLDRFKSINDSLGHSFGDLLLEEVARRLTNATRPGDTVARLGGDEFVIVAEGMDNQQADVLAARIQEHLNVPVVIGGNEIRVSASIGLALSRPGLRFPDAILRDADAAMYRAKEAGRGRAEMFDDRLRAQANSRHQTEQRLVDAINENRLRALYQPVVNPRSGEVVGVETLIRYHDPQRGLISPHDFLGVAEETGLITRIDSWVFNHACQQLAAWTENFPTMGIGVGCNLSSAQLGRHDLIDVTKAAIDKYSLNVDDLIFEVSELALMTATSTTISNLRRLCAMGCRVGFDDFGTGFSSMNHLRDIPVTFIKIDMSFTAQLGLDPFNDAVVHSITDLAHTLGLNVVAEGVERPEQAAMLLDMGIDRLQGYLYSRPVEASQITAILASGGFITAQPTLATTSGESDVSP